MAGETFKDSGKRRDFSTGANRDVTNGKGRRDLVPPFSIMFLSRVYEIGCLKYGDRNWEKGIPLGVYIDSALRHLEKYQAGLRDEPHLSMAFWNVGCALWTAASIKLGTRPKELFDLPNHITKEDIGPLSEHEENSLSTYIGRPLE